MNSQMDPEFRNATSFQVVGCYTAFTCNKVEQQTFCDWWTAARFENKAEKDETPALLLLTCFYEDSKSFSCFVIIGVMLEWQIIMDTYGNWRPTGAVPSLRKTTTRCTAQQSIPHWVAKSREGHAASWFTRVLMQVWPFLHPSQNAHLSSLVCLSDR